MVADIEELAKLDASDILARRLDAQEIITSKKGEEFIFPIADGTAKLVGRDHEIRESTVRQYETVGSEDLSEELQRNSDEPQPPEKRKGRWSPTSGRLKDASFIVIMLNFECISTYWKKNHSQYHWSTLTWSYFCKARNWKGDFLVADIEELEKMDVSEIYPRRINAKEVLTSQRRHNFIFQSQMDHQNCVEEKRIPRTHCKAGTICREWRSQWELQGEPEGLQPTESKDVAETRRDFWAIQGDFIYRHHIELRVQLYVS